VTTGDRIGFWAVAFAFLVVMAFATLPSPLYGLYRERDGLSAFTITIVYAIWAAGTIVTLVAVPFIAERIGRRGVMFAAVATMMVAAGVLVAWKALPGLLVGRLITGFAVGMAAGTAIAYLIELRLRADPKASPAVPRTIGTSVNVGALGIGPLVAGCLAQWASHPLTLPYLVWIALGAVALAGLGTAPETGAPAAARNPFTVRLPVPAGAGTLAAFAANGLFAGLSGSFDWADADFDGVETSKSKALRQSGEKLTAYGGGHAGPFFAQFALTAGHDRYHSDRDIDIAGFTATKDATWNGNQLAAQATIGGHFRLGRAWIEPSDTFSWLRIHQNGYTEQNGEVLDLAVSSEKINGDTNAAKLAAGYAVPAADGAISFELRGSYLSQLDRNLPGLVVRYANEDTPFTLETNRLPSHEIREGLSVAYQPKDADWRFSVNASHEDYQGYSDTGLAIAARAKF